MNNNIPYYKQETVWTCGAACMRMILESLGIKKTEKQLAKKLESNKIVGTWEHEIPELAEKYKLTYFVERNGSIDDLKKYLNDDFRVVVCYLRVEENVAHYAVLHRIYDEHMYLYDPWYGQDYKLKTTYFNTIWESDPVHEKDKRWFIAIKK